MRSSHGPLRAAVLLAVLVTLGALSPAGAAVSRQVFPVAETGADNLEPAVSGDIVVWAARADNGLFDIRGKNLLTGTEFVVAEDPANEARDQTSPATSGDLVVWEDDRNGDLDLFARNVGDPGAAEFAVATGPGDQFRPDVTGDLAVWEDREGGDSDIVARRLPDGAAFPVADGPGDQRRPAASGDTVVWEDNGGGDLDVFARDLSARRTIGVSTADGAQDTPDVGGGTVVWRDDRGPGGFDIRGRRLTGGGEFEVAGGAEDQVTPATDGRVVVWTADAGGDPDVFGRDLTTGETFPVATEGTPQETPAVGGGTVVWESQRQGSPGFGAWDVSGARLDLAPRAPAGLGSKGTLAGVELVWKANLEGDLAGYNVYSSASAGDPFHKLNASLLQVPSYDDSAAPRGQVSRYRVAAVDAAGSESAAATTSAAALARTHLGLSTVTSSRVLRRRTLLAGRLTAVGGGVSGGRVILEHRHAGDRAFSRVPGQPSAGVATNDTGRYSLSGVLTRKTTVYRARFAGIPQRGLLPSLSPTRRVNARAAVSSKR